MALLTLTHGRTHTRALTHARTRALTRALTRTHTPLWLIAVIIGLLRFSASAHAAHACAGGGSSEQVPTDEGKNASNEGGKRVGETSNCDSDLRPHAPTHALTGKTHTPASMDALAAVNSLGVPQEIAIKTEVPVAVPICESVQAFRHWLRKVAGLHPLLIKPFEKVHRSSFNNAKLADVLKAAEEGISKVTLGANELERAWDMSRAFVWHPDGVQTAGKRATAGRTEDAVDDDGFKGKNIRVGPPSELPPFPHAPAPHTPARRPLGFVTNS
jgi:hypothetical protein